MTDDLANPTDTDRNWEALRTKADQADSLATELADLRRKDAFRDAGLDPTNPLHAVVMKGYDGEMDATKVREFVNQVGVLTPSGPPPEDEATKAARAAQGRIGQASEGGDSPQPSTGVQAAIEEMNAAASSARSEVELDHMLRDITNRHRG